METWLDFHGVYDHRTCSPAEQVSSLLAPDIRLSRGLDWLDLWPDIHRLNPALSESYAYPYAYSYPSTPSASTPPSPSPSAINLDLRSQISDVVAPHSKQPTPLTAQEKEPKSTGSQTPILPSSSSCPSISTATELGSQTGSINRTRYAGLLSSPPELSCSQSSLPFIQICTPPSSPYSTCCLSTRFKDETGTGYSDLTPPFQLDDGRPVLLPHDSHLDQDTSVHQFERDAAVIDRHCGSHLSNGSPQTPSPSSASLALDSPFARLGLCSPRKRLSTPSPRSLPAITSVPSSPSPWIELDEKEEIGGYRRERRELSPPSPGWMPDTPTPVRFYRSSLRDKQKKLRIAIQPPKQPIFNIRPICLELKPVSAHYSSPGNYCHSSQPSQPTESLPNKTALATDCDEGKVRVNWVTHLSTDGGIVSSLRRLKRKNKMEDEIGGMNVFLHPPKKRVTRSMNEEVILEARCLMEELGTAFRSNSMAHAVHTTNLLSTDPETRRLARESIIAELRSARDLGIPTLVIHLGSDTRETCDEDDRGKMMKRMQRLILDLQVILGGVSGTRLAIENTTHRSPTSLASLSAISLLLTRFPHPSLYLCLDLTHLHISELNLNDPSDREKLFALLGRLQGKIAAIHVGDSCSDHGGKGERHVNGHIDPSSLRAILRHPLLRGIPTLLETPPYYKELRLSSSSFSTRISDLEAERAANERCYVQGLINVNPALGQNSKVTVRYANEKKRIESAIYKAYHRTKSKKEGQSVERFKRSRKNALQASRRVQGLKRTKVNARTRRRSALCGISETSVDQGGDCISGGHASKSIRHDEDAVRVKLEAE